MTNREKLLRRVALKCADFTRQLSYHRALMVHRNGNKLNFWIYMYNNAIDLATLDWFHLFGYHNDDLHWKQITNDVDVFRDGLLKHLSIDMEEWIKYRETIKTYRDKDIAHIEVRPLSNVPSMSTALEAANFYYKHVFLELKQYGNYSKWPSDLIEYYESSFQQTLKIVDAARLATIGIKEQVY